MGALLNLRTVQKLAEYHMALEAADTEVSRLKQESLEWRKRAALYKLKLASKEEAVVQRQENISVLEGLLQACVGEREELLHRCSQLQQQLQQWSAVCQSQHRARVQEQVRTGHLYAVGKVGSLR